jgi:hypothetical protein
MSLLGLLGWAVIAVGGYFIVKFTIKWIMDKIDQYFLNKEVDGAVISDIGEMMDNCTNKKSYELLKKAREKGYSHIMGKTQGGRITGDIDFVKDENSALDPEVRELLGPEKMVLIER